MTRPSDKTLKRLGIFLGIPSVVVLVVGVISAAAIRWDDVDESLKIGHENRKAIEVNATGILDTRALITDVKSDVRDLETRTDVYSKRQEDIITEQKALRVEVTEGFKDVIREINRVKP